MIVNGIEVLETDLSAALASFGESGFVLRDLQSELERLGIDTPISYETAKRLLQRERKAGTYLHDTTSGEWRLAGSTPLSAPEVATTPQATVQTLPLNPISEQETSHPNESLSDRASSLYDRLWLATGLVACAAAVVALALINASFAWQVAETDSFRVAFVLGLAASDLMRPLLIARGLWEIGQHRVFTGGAAIAVALALAPVSIISSTAVVSAALHLGIEESVDRSTQENARWTIQSEYDRLTRLSSKTWKAWEEECSRGGCGDVAEGLEETAKGFEKEARKRFDELLALSEEGTTNSSFLSRTATAFQQSGVFGLTAIVTIPLLIALSLEIAALFGPGILLARRRKARRPTGF